MYGGKFSHRFDSQPHPKKLQLTNTGKHPLGRGKSTKISHTIGQISLFIGMGMRDSEIT